MHSNVGLAQKKCWLRINRTMWLCTKTSNVWISWCICECFCVFYLLYCVCVCTRIHRKTLVIFTFFLTHSICVVSFFVMQRVKEEVQRRKKQSNLSSSHNNNNDHDEFHARLSPARFQDSPLQPKLLVNGLSCDRVLIGACEYEDSWITFVFN